MSRSMTTAVQTELDQRAIRMCRLVELRFDSGTEYHTDGHKAFEWNGNTYLPGNLMAVSNVSESLPMETREVSITVSGVNQGNLATSLLQLYIDRTVVVYRALLDATDTIIPDPIQAFFGYIDRWRFREDPSNGTATLQWFAASQLVRFDKIAGRRTNDEDQQLHYPGDRFFQFTSAVDADIPWGRPN